MGPCKTPGINNVIPLTGATGRLFSPRYPQRVPNDMRCTWIITVPDGHYVKLRITSLFLDTSCDKVTLKIRDGQSSSSDLLRNFCGRTFETSLFSSGRHLWVQFHSAKDAFSVGSGFNAIFEMVSQCKLCCCYCFCCYHISKVYCQPNCARENEEYLRDIILNFKEKVHWR